MANEAFARIKIDQLLKDAEWRLTDGQSVRYEYLLDDGGKADYVLFDRQGRALAVLEAKSTSVNLSAGEAQGLRNAEQLGVPFIFLSNGEEIWFRDHGQDAHFRRVETIFGQDDLARRNAARDIRRNPLDIAIDTRIAGGGGRLHQTACVDVVCREIAAGRRVQDKKRVTIVTLQTLVNEYEKIGSGGRPHRHVDGEEFGRADAQSRHVGVARYVDPPTAAGRTATDRGAFGPRGAIGQANINVKELRAFPVAVPPLPLQTAFAEQVQRIEATARVLDAAAVKAEAMTAALSADVFG